MFNRFFREFDINQDGVISKKEMAKFFKEFLKNPNLKERDEIIENVNRIWFKYDIDRSGALDRRETLRFVNDFLASKNMPPSSLP